MVMSFSGENISHAASTVNGRLMLFFAVTMPSFASCIKNMGVTSIFLAALAYNIGPGAVNKSSVLKS